MASKLGYFGQELFGTGFFGAVTASVPMPLFLVNTGWEKVFTQTTETEMVIALKVYRNGATESNTDTDRVSVVAAENRIGITAEMGASLGSGYAIGDQVQITVEITPGSGMPFKISLFNGFVSTIATGLASIDDEEAVTVYLTTSQNKMLDEVPSVTSWTGYAAALLEYALLHVGCADININIDNYWIDQSLSFSTWRDLIKEIASGLTESTVAIMASGVGYVRAWDRTNSIFESDPTGFLIPRSGWTSQQKQDSVSEQFRSVAVQGVGGIIGYANGSDGVGVDNFVTSNFCTTVLQCHQKAHSILNRSKRQTRVITTPINPFLTIGSLLRVTTTAGTVSGKILALSHSCEWSDGGGGGFWTNVTIGIDP